MRALLAHGDFNDAAADCGCHDNRMDKIWNELWMAGWWENTTPNSRT